MNGVGFCSLDRTRSPLRADEVRACWQAPETVEPPLGLFAMVEALEASTAHAGADEYDTSDEGVSGLDRLRRLVSGARSNDPANGERTEADMWAAEQAAPGTEAAAADPAGGATGRGRLHDAEVVTPGLRLSYRDDAGSLHDAAMSAAGGLRPNVSGR